MFQTSSKIYLKFNSIRFLSTQKLQIKELKLKEYANSNEFEKSLTLTITDKQIEKLKEKEIIVKLLAAPINPADINIIQGKYGILPKSLPASIGNEALFEVIQTNETSDFKQGDWVLPNKVAWGTWRSHAIETEDSFIKLPSKPNLTKESCSTLSINPITAYRMLNDFKQLKPNDTVIQNGANSAVGQAVVQFGNLMNINVVNIVRKRSDIQQQKKLNEHLERHLNAKYIFTEDELRKSAVSDLWTKIPKPKLALNCVGGKATVDMVRHLDYDSTLVTYGGMSKQPLTFNTSDFIFKDLKCVGFWLTRWRQTNPDEFKNTINLICDLISNGKFKAPKCEEFSLDNYEQAFQRFRTPFLESKILLTL